MRWEGAENGDSRMDGVMGRWQRENWMRGAFCSENGPFV